MFAVTLRRGLYDVDSWGKAGQISVPLCVAHKFSVRIVDAAFANSCVCAINLGDACSAFVDVLFCELDLVEVRAVIAVNDGERDVACAFGERYGRFFCLVCGPLVGPLVGGFERNDFGAFASVNACGACAGGGEGEAASFAAAICVCHFHRVFAGKFYVNGDLDG